MIEDHQNLVIDRWENNHSAQKDYELMVEKNKTNTMQFTNNVLKMNKNKSVPKILSKNAQQNSRRQFITKRNSLKNPETQIKKIKVPSQCQLKILNERISLIPLKDEAIMTIKEEISLEDIEKSKIQQEKEQNKSFLKINLSNIKVREAMFQRIVKSQNQHEKPRKKEHVKLEDIGSRSKTKNDMNFKSNLDKSIFRSCNSAEKTPMKLSQLNFFNKGSNFTFQAVKQPSKMDQNNLIKRLKYEKLQMKQIITQDSINSYKFMSSTFRKNDFTDISKYNLQQKTSPSSRYQQLKTQSDLNKAYKHIFNQRFNDKTLIKCPSRYKIINP